MTKTVIYLFILVLFILCKSPVFPAEAKVSVDKTLSYTEKDNFSITFTVKHLVNERLILKESDIRLDHKIFLTHFFVFRIPFKKGRLILISNPIHKTESKIIDGNEVIWDTFHYNVQLNEAKSFMIASVQFVIEKGGKRFSIFTPKAYIHSFFRNEQNVIEQDDNLFLITVFILEILTIFLFILLVGNMFRDRFIIFKNKLNNPPSKSDPNHKITSNNKDLST